jgi:hypothetical protein
MWDPTKGPLGAKSVKKSTKTGQRVPLNKALLKDVIIFAEVYNQAQVCHGPQDKHVTLPISL